MSIKTNSYCIFCNGFSLVSPRGLIPLDAADEGFAGIGATITLNALQVFVEARISGYEREEARRAIYM